MSATPQPQALAGSSPDSVGSSSLESVSRPLLMLVKHITGMETTFVTAIDWDGQKQDVLFSLNTGDMQVSEGSQVDWHESMCRSVFLSGLAHTADVGGDVHATPAALALSMQSFVAVPILTGDVAIGTVCGASRHRIALSEEQVVGMQYIAQALQTLMGVVRERSEAEARANAAELHARQADAYSSRNARELEEMERLAHTDVLTGLPNRRAFTARWEDELARSGRRGHAIGLILIDVDRFKSVNDTGGHGAGDALLVAFGKTLLDVARTPDIVARLGGDEFAFVRTHTDAEGLKAVSEAIRQNFKDRAKLLDVSTTLSFGIASSEDCARHELLAGADKGLYLSKAAGGDKIVQFECEAANTEVSEQAIAGDG